MTEAALTSPKPYLSVPETCRLIGVTRDFWRSYILPKKPPMLRHNPRAHPRIPREQFMAWYMKNFPA